MSYTSNGASWELVDFNNLSIGSDQLNSDYESIVNDENAQLTASPTYPTLDDVAADLAASAPIIVPSASTDYSYDFGLMNKLPFDDRIVWNPHNRPMPIRGLKF